MASLTWRTCSYTHLLLSSCSCVQITGAHLYGLDENEERMYLNTTSKHEILCLPLSVGILSHSLSEAISINLLQPVGPALNIFISFDFLQCVTSGHLFLLVDFFPYLKELGGIL